MKRGCAQNVTLKRMTSHIGKATYTKKKQKTKKNRLAFNNKQILFSNISII